MAGVNGEAVFSPNRVGWTAGAGIEYLLAARWSAKAEYAFLDFGTATIGTGALVPGNYIRVDTKEHEVKVGLNYHWGS